MTVELFVLSIIGLVILLGIIVWSEWNDARSPKHARKLIKRIASDIVKNVGGGTGSKEEWKEIFLISDYILASNLPYSIIVSPKGKLTFYIDRVLVEDLNVAERHLLKSALVQHLKKEQERAEWQRHIHGIKLLDVLPKYNGSAVVEEGNE